MKIKKIIKSIAVSMGGLALLLFVTLIVHIAVMVKKMPPLAYATIQVGRADFMHPVDSLSAVSLEKKVQEMSGVKSTYFNLKDYTLVYMFDNRVNSAQHIYDQAIKGSGFASRRYVVTAVDMEKGCPVMNDHTFYGKLTAAVTKVIR